MATSSHNLSKYNPHQLPSAEKYRFTIFVSEWNAEITESLLEGCLEVLKTHNCPMENIEVYHVPGSYELAQAANIYLSNISQKPDAIICLGCVIRGETPHFEFISQAVSQGIKDVSLKHNIPIVFGVLTDNNIAQSRERSGGKHGNKGVEAAITAIKMASLAKKFFKE